MKKLILLTLAIVALLSTVSTGFAYEVSVPTNEWTESDDFYEDELWEDEYDVDDYIPDGWYDPEYGSMVDSEGELSTQFGITAHATRLENEEEPVVVPIIVVRRTAVTVRGNVPMRAGSDPSSRTVRTLSANTNVRITGRQGNKYRIRHNSTTGWVLRTNLVRTRPTAVVRSNNVAVRTSRSTSSRVLTRVDRGQRLVITQQTGTWSRVTVNRRTGWVRNSQLRISNGRRPGRTTRATALHARPDANSNVRMDLPANQDFMILQRTVNGNGAHQGWTQVRIRHNGGTQTGWIRTNRVRRANHVRRIRGGSAPFRTGPSSSNGRHRRVRSISNNTQVRVLAEIGNWSHVRVRVNGRNEYGWVASSRITRISISTFDAIFEYAQQYQGRPHVMGGNNPRTGFDCSGFVQWIYGAHGVTLPRSSQQQFDAGTRVSNNNAQPGDLVFFEGTFSSRDRITHVGMYVGGGRMLHMSSSGVRFDNVRTGWWGNHFVGFRRVLN